MQHRVAGALAGCGARHPSVAAAILSARGACGLDPEMFAHELGVGIELLRRAEAGELALEELPGALRWMVPDA